ncbi:MAG: YHS domain-containing protein [Pirellulales bacterium]|nr:YHS domain-containing protein [Pirellulales bacterium]
MKVRLLSVALFAALIAVAQLSAIGDDKEEFSAKCVVSGAPAKEANSVAYKGKKVYFCCQNCPKAFEADPEKFANKAAAQLLATKQIVQVACPLAGKPVNPEQTVEVAGSTVAFCCGGCKGKAAKASGDDLLALVFGDLAKGFTLQTKCPISNKPIDAAVSVEHDGQKVFFCCDGCPDAFEKDPAKFTAKLPQFQEAK